MKGVFGFISFKKKFMGLWVYEKRDYEFKKKVYRFIGL